MPLWLHAHRCPVSCYLSLISPITSQPESASSSTSSVFTSGGCLTANAKSSLHILPVKYKRVYFFPISSQKFNKSLILFLHLSETDTEQGMRSDISSAILYAWFRKLFEMPRRERAPLLWCFVSVFLHLCTDERKIKNAFPSLSVNQYIHQQRTSRMFK